MKKQRLHIGELIKKRVDELGMTDAGFGRKINVSRQNAQNIYTRQSIDSEMLALISDVLELDFFSYYKTGKKQKFFDISISKKPKVVIEFELNEAEILKLGLIEKVTQLLEE
jgi:hypothetical protein